MEEKGIDSTSIDILDLIHVLVKHKKFIIIVTIIVSIFAVIYSLLVPQYWISKSSFMPIDSDSGGLSLDASSLLSMGSSLLGGSNTDGSELITVMKSRTFSEKVINHFNLIEVLEIRDKDSSRAMAKTVERLLTKIVNMSYDDDENVIVISAETKDKNLSANLVNYYVKEIEKYNLSNKMSKGREKRKFIEQRLTSVEGEIDSLTALLYQIQKDNKIIEFETQSKEIIELYADLYTKKYEKEIELEFSQKIFANNLPLVQNLEEELISIDKAIKEIEFNPDNSDYILNLDEIAEIGLEYRSIMAYIEIQKKVYEFLYSQYEQAKIEELKDIPTIEIIDKAVPAGLRSKPKRAIVCVSAFLLTFIISSIIVYLNDLLIKTGKSDKIKEILRDLF